MKASDVVTESLGGLGLRGLGFRAWSFSFWFWDSAGLGFRDVRSSPWLGRSGGNPNPIVKTFWGLILGFCMVSEKRLPVNIGVNCMDRIEML